jgi:hypothetical protein
MQLNTITQQQAVKLAQAQELLSQADALMQEGLGACDFCSKCTACWRTCRTI